MKTLKKNFSMVEVVVVAAVIAILASLVVSASRSVREAGKRTTCLNNLKQIQAVVEAYKKDNRKAPFNYVEGRTTEEYFGDFTFAADYISAGDLETFFCPGDDSREIASTDQELLDSLDGGTSYLYVPTKSDLEDAGIDTSGMSRFMIVVDKSSDHHNGDVNVLYLHGEGNTKGGVASTLKGDEWNLIDESDLGSSTNEDASDSSTSSSDSSTSSSDSSTSSSDTDSSASTVSSDSESSFEDYVNQVNSDTDMTLEEYLADASKSVIKKWEDVIYTESTGDAFEGGYTTEAIEGTLVEGKSSDPSVSAIYSTDGLKVTAASDEELINVVLEYSDGAIQKFEALPGTQVTVWGTADNEGKIISNVWIRAGENSSGDGPDFGEYLKLSITGNNGWGNGDQTATGNSLENNNAENDTDGQTHQIHGKANPN